MNVLSKEHVEDALINTNNSQLKSTFDLDAFSLINTKPVTLFDG